MIYGFLKQNSNFFTEKEQQKSIEEYSITQGLEIDRWLLDNYKNRYNEIYNIKRGMSSGAYIFDLQPGDILICYTFSTLCYSYKTALFLLKTAVERGATVYFSRNNTKIDYTYLATLNVLYTGICEFHDLHNVRLYKLCWNNSKNPFVLNKDETIKLIKQGLPMRQICMRMQGTQTSFRTFIKQYPDLEKEYKELNPQYGRGRGISILEHRALLPKRVKDCARKTNALIKVPESYRAAIENRGNDDTF